MRNRYRIAAILLLALSLLVYVFWATYREVKSQKIADLNRLQLQHARVAAASIEKTVKKQLSYLEFLARQPEIMGLNAKGREHLRFTYRLHADELRGISRMDARGNILYTYPERADLIGKNISSQEHVQAALRTRRPTVSDVFTAVQGFSTIALHVPVFDDKDFRGTLAVLLSFEDFAQRHLAEIRIGKSGYAWMMTAKGTEIFCPVPGHVGHSVFDNCKDFPDILAMARNMVRGEEGITTYTFDRIRGNSTEKVVKHAVYLPVRMVNTYWSIVVATPEDEVAAGMSGFAFRWISTLLALILAAVLLTYSWARNSATMTAQAERLEGAAALEASEKRFRRLADASPLGIALVNEEGKNEYANPAFTTILGYTRDDLPTLEDWFCKAYPDPVYRESVLASWEKALREAALQNVWSDVFSVRCRDGRDRYIRFRISFLEHGRFIGLLEDISEQKKLEDTLKDQEERFRGLFENMSSGVAIYRAVDDGEDFVFVDMNHAGVAITRQKREDILGKRVTDIFPGVRAFGLLRVFQEVWRTGKPQDHDERHYQDARLAFWARNRVYRLPSGEIVAIFEDITASKRAADALSQIAWLLDETAPARGKADSPQPYGDLAAMNPSGPIAAAARDVLPGIVDDCLDLLDSSAAVSERNGAYALATFRSAWCRFLDAASRDLCHTPDHAAAMSSGSWHCHESCWADASRAAIASGRPVDIACRGGIRMYAVPIRVTGQVVGAINIGYGDPPKTDAELDMIATRYGVEVAALKACALAYSSRPLFIIDVAKKRLLTAARLIGEIVERRRAEEALRNSEEKFRLLVETSPDVVWETDPEGRFRYISPGVEHLLGYTPDEMKDRLIFEFFDAADAAVARPFFDRLREERRTLRGFPATPRHRDGRKIPTEVSASPYYDAEGVLAGIRGVSVDRSERTSGREGDASSPVGPAA